MAAADHEGLAGAYALDALTEQERSRFESHLGGCASCRDEVREFRETAARLGAASAVGPRPELRAQTLRAALRTTQLGPRRLTIRRSFLTPARIAVAAAVVLAAGATATAIAIAMQSEVHQLSQSQRQGHMIASVLNAPDAVMLTAKISTGGTATVVMSHREHALVFTAHGLRSLPADRGYELWLMGPRGVRAAGMLVAPPGGMAGPAVVSGLSSGDMVGVTVEPAGGSPRPTSAPVVMIGGR